MGNRSSAPGPYTLMKRNPNETTRHKPNQNARPSRRAPTNPFHCFMCRNELNRGRVMFNDQLATVRVFAGSGGPRAKGHLDYAACARHHNATIELVFAPLRKPESRAGAWMVACYAVDIDPKSREPSVGRLLFAARRRSLEPGDLAVG